MTPVEHWMCQGCDDLYLTEQDALACHPPYRDWACGQCGDSWTTRVEAERCCVEDDL